MESKVIFTSFVLTNALTLLGSAMTKAPCVNNKDRLQVVSNFGDGDCGVGKYTHAKWEISRSCDVKCVCFACPTLPLPKLEVTCSL